MSINWIANDGDIDPNADINATILADMKKSADDGKQYRMAVLRLKEGGSYTVNADALSFSDEKGFAVAPFEKLDLTQVLVGYIEGAAEERARELIGLVRDAFAPLIGLWHRVPFFVAHCHDGTAASPVLWEAAP